MIQKCDSCGHESGSCNSYLLEDMRTITVCPGCLIWGNDEISQRARLAHTSGRMVREKTENDPHKKKRQRRRRV